MQFPIPHSYPTTAMIKKVLLIGFALIVLVFIGLFVYSQTSWDKTYDWPGPGLHASTDSTVIARGKYLVEGPAHCGSCHISNFDDLVAGDEGKDVPLKGGVRFPMGPLGAMYTRNLTPDKSTGIGRYSDEQVFRMMRHGIRPNGLASMPVLMPFWKMADDDLVAIVSYLRSLTPIENAIPENEWTVMGKAVRSFASTFEPIKNPDAPAVAPAMAASVERGEYLARYVANCVGCHTKRDLMTYEPTAPEFAGGMEFEPWPELYAHLKTDPDAWIRTPNITPDPGGVLKNYSTAESFIARFRKGRLIAFSPMDWGPFSRMSDEDLTAIWMYLNGLPPVKHDVGPLVFKK
jgi:mono/diheme cytochrome c family protein